MQQHLIRYQLTRNGGAELRFDPAHARRPEPLNRKLAMDKDYTGPSPAAATDPTSLLDSGTTYLSVQPLK